MWIAAFYRYAMLMLHNDLIPSIRAGVTQDGGVAVEFPVMSLGEDLMKPAAMLYRNLVAMEVEESYAPNRSTRSSCSPRATSRCPRR